MPNIICVSKNPNKIQGLFNARDSSGVKNLLVYGNSKSKLMLPWK